MNTSNPGKKEHKGTKNLIPVKKGERRNPTGRNQYTWLRESGIKVLEEMLEHGGKKKESLRLILEKLRYEFLVKGNVAAGKELLDRVFGRPHQSVDVTTNGQNIGALPVDIDVSKITESEKEALRSAIKRSK